jgi:hypothetical protein
MADRVADVRTDETEGIDRANRKVRMRKINPGADDADPNTFSCESHAPKRRRLDALE